MIPFPMITKYTISTPKFYSKLVCSRLSIGILTSDNENNLFCTGDNTRFGMGIPRTTFASMISPVEDAWSCMNWSLVRKNNGEYWWSGSSNPFGITTGVPWSNVSSRFTGVGIIKKLIMSSTAIYVLNTLGEVWAVGGNNYGSYGRGNTTTSTVFVKLANATDVKDIYTYWDSVDNLYLLKNDNSLWGAGYGGRGSMGAANSSTNVISSFIPLSTDVQEFKVTSYAFFVKKSDGNWYATGSNGTFGTGNASSAYVDDYKLSINGGAIGIARIFPDDAAMHLIGVDNKLYYGGASSSVSPISGSTVNNTDWTSPVLSYTEVPGYNTSWTSAIRDIAHFGGTASYMLLNNTVYGCGNTGSSANYSLLPPYSGSGIYGWRELAGLGLR